MSNYPFKFVITFPQSSIEWVPWTFLEPSKILNFRLAESTIGKTTRDYLNSAFSGMTSLSQEGASAFGQSDFPKAFFLRPVQISKGSELLQRFPTRDLVLSRSPSGVRTEMTEENIDAELFLRQIHSNDESSTSQYIASHFLRNHSDSHNGGYRGLCSQPLERPKVLVFLWARCF